MTVERRKVDQVGRLAIEPAALLLAFPGAVAAEPFKLDGPNAIVEITGPIEARGDACFFDSYESILKRVSAACASPASTVVLRINSPGGAVSGCFATARAIRRVAQASGKRLVAYVDECAVSAAYALATAAELIALPPTGRVGSIGVIEVLPSFARQDQAQGIDVSVITSGARKADGHPAVPMTDDARAALQLGVDRMAEAFFELVAEHRGGRAPGEFASLQAAVYYGQDAVTIGLADQVSDFDGFKAALAAPQPTGATQVTKAELMAALSAMAEDEKSDDAPMAKRMLAAMDPPKDDEEKKPGEEPAAQEPPMPEKKEEPAAVAALASTVNAMAAQLAAIDAEKRAKLEADRAAAFAARPDVPEVLRKALAAAPLADVQAALAAIPVANPAAAATVQGARGASEGGAQLEGVSYLSDQAAELDRKMGLVPEGRAVVTEGTRTYFGKAVAAPKKGS